MSGPFSQIIIVSTGCLNSVNDTVIANQAGISGESKFKGQLGKILHVAQDQIAMLTDTSVGTLFGGTFQYVKLADNLGTPAPVIGQMLFWDTSEAIGDFVVTDTKDETAVPNPAGVYIGGAEAGNYGFIQTSGQVYGKFKASITNVPSTGQGLVVTSLGFFDNDTPVNPIYVGWAVELPVNFALKKVQLNPMAFRA